MPIQECMHRCYNTNAQSPKPINITMTVKALTANLPEWQWLIGCYISWIWKDRHILGPLKLNTRPEHTVALRSIGTLSVHGQITARDLRRVFTPKALASSEHILFCLYLWVKDSSKHTNAQISAPWLEHKLC